MKTTAAYFFILFLKKTCVYKDNQVTVLVQNRWNSSKILSPYNEYLVLKLCNNNKNQEKQHDFNNLKSFSVKSIFNVSLATVKILFTAF